MQGVLRTSCPSFVALRAFADMQSRPNHGLRIAVVQTAVQG